LEKYAENQRNYLRGRKMSIGDGKATDFWHDA
jgi:hypothetical protein